MKDIHISDMKEYVDYVNQLPNHYIYRGHSSQKWYLKSTLERVLDKNFAQDADRFEKYAIKEFESRYHLYDDSNIRPETKLQWLSLLQHYGAPTRLLDFSISPYIALYFALEFVDPSSKDDMVVYAIDYRELLSKSIEFIKTQDKAFTYSYSEALANQESIFRDNIDRFNYNILWIAEPKIANYRLDKQDGCFLISCNNNKSIEDLLNLPLYSTVNVSKIIIPLVIYKNALELLNRVGLTSKNLYGDLTGLAKSIKMTMVQYS
jgi:hypothetical protein